MANDFARPVVVDNDSPFAEPVSMYDSEGNPLASDVNDIVREAQGLVAETFSRMACVATQALTSRGLYLTMVGLRKGQLVTSLSISINGAAAVTTLGKLGLYDKEGNLLAETASQTTAWESTGLKTVDLVSPLEIPATDAYYAAVLAVADTPPTIYRGAVGSSTIMAAIGSGLPPWATVGSQDDLPDTLAVPNAGTGPMWVGLS
jgi:hypothetical protein